MEYIARLFALLFFGLLLFIIQVSSSFSFFGLHPNFILVFFIMCIVFPVHRVSLFLALGFFVFLMSTITRFWVFDVFVFCAVVLLCLLIRRVLTGRMLFDFFVLLFFGTGLFFFGNPLVNHIAQEGFNFSVFSFPPLSPFFLEFFLSAVFGILLIFLADRRPLSFLFGK
jgi:hypothetical protein